MILLLTEMTRVRCYLKENVRFFYRQTNNTPYRIFSPHTPFTSHISTHIPVPHS